MALSSLSQSIITNFETLGMSPEAIAEDLQVDIGAVKLTLAQFSTLYRNLTLPSPTSKSAESAQPSSLFNDQDMQSAVGAISELMSTAENEGVRLRAAQFVINEKKGRNDRKVLNNLRLDVTVINEQLQKAREAKERAKAKVIDIRPEDAAMINALTEPANA